MKGFREVDLTDEEQGLIKLMWPIPNEDGPWGVLTPLKDTSWGKQIVEVPGEALSHALHGWATPLVRVLGVPPRVHANRIPDADGICTQIDSCIGATPDCRPGLKTPDCYEAPKLPVGVRMLATYVVLAWKEGRYVIVVQGDEFNL